jgi:hypothetical protein
MHVSCHCLHVPKPPCSQARCVLSDTSASADMFTSSSTSLTATGDRIPVDIVSFSPLIELRQRPQRPAVRRERRHTMSVVVLFLANYNLRSSRRSHRRGPESAAHQWVTSVRSCCCRLTFLSFKMLMSPIITTQFHCRLLVSSI